MQYAIKNRRTITHVTENEVAEWYEARDKGGLSNKLIAKMSGRSYLTVLHHIGPQPKVMTANNRRNGRMKKQCDRNTINENIVAMKNAAVEVVSEKNVEMKLLEKFVSVLSTEERLVLSKMMKKVS